MIYFMQESEKLIVASEKVKSDSEQQKGAVDNLFSSIETLEATTKDFENQAFSDAEKSQRVLRKATVAESNAKNLQEQLTKSEESLFHALDLLSKSIF